MSEGIGNQGLGIREGDRQIHEAAIFICEIQDEKALESGIVGNLGNVRGCREGVPLKRHEYRVVMQAGGVKELEYDPPAQR